ncbi:MAG: hypothetical protein IPN23_02790 [Elusimicrobia bacterium]|nr:hypothetical protein [Elusimicrobiota bacterium]
MKKTQRGIVFPLKKKYSGDSAGLSLVEIVISVAVLFDVGRGRQPPCSAERPHDR